MIDLAGVEANKEELKRLIMRLTALGAVAENFTDAREIYDRTVSQDVADFCRNTIDAIMTEDDLSQTFTTLLQEEVDAIKLIMQKMQQTQTNGGNENE